VGEYAALPLDAGYFDRDASAVEPVPKDLARQSRIGTPTVDRNGYEVQIDESLLSLDRSPPPSAPSAYDVIGVYWRK